jgi:hypothetical protein
MTWAKLVAGLVGLLSRLIDSFNDAKQRKAGRDEVLKEQAVEELKSIDEAALARTNPDLLNRVRASRDQANRQ